MQKSNVEFVIGQAQDERQTEDFAKAVAGSIEVGVVVPSILRANLIAAGFTIIDDEASLAEYGFASAAILKRVIISDGANMIAMGAAADPTEALLASVLGWFREHPLPDAVVPEGMTPVEAPVS